MKVPIPLQLAVIMVGLTGLYTMVGQAVPQKEVRPPEVIEIARDISPAEMAEIGREIYEGKGICFTCHANTSRYPDLQDIATRAASRLPGYSALDYLLETLYEPDAYIVEGFNPGMPAVDKPPIGLTDDEILTVVAYLQSLGGTPEVTMDTLHAYNGGAAAGAVQSGAVVAQETVSAPGDTVARAAAGTDPLRARGCTNCHHTDRAGEIDGSPSLWDVGRRLDRQQLLSELVFHEGDDVLGAASQAEIRELVSAMADLQGQGSQGQGSQGQG